MGNATFNRLSPGFTRFTPWRRILTDLQASLRDFKPTRSFFVGIDSDGCTFDTMELKHKECFIPNTIRYYGLQAVSKFAREVAEFVNLYSEWRGINRFPSLTMTLNLLKERPEVKRRGVKVPRTEALQKFIDSGKPLGNPSLKEEIEKSKSPGTRPDLELALEWSEAVNHDVAEMVHGVAPFPFVRQCLEKLRKFADMMCVSATPVGALTAEWEEHDIAKYVRLIVGQEIASKKEAIKAAVDAGLDRKKVLMVGDAPGDMKAAQSCGALFYPVIPGDEETSWERLYQEALGKFQDLSFSGRYEDSLIESFLKKLPSTPPWKGGERRESSAGSGTVRVGNQR